MITPTTRRVLMFAGALLCALANPVFARPTVGLLLKFRGGEFWGALEEGAKASADAAQVDLVVKGIADPGNFTAQLKMLDALVAQGVDAIIITPANPERLAGPLRELAAKGVKIIVAETEAPVVGIPFVGIDQARLSLDMATAIAAALADGDQVALFRGTASDRIIARREPAMLARLKELRPAVRVHGDIYAVDDDTTTATQKAELLLQKYPEAKLYIATSTGSTNSLLHAVRNRGLADHARVAGFGTGLSPEMVDAISKGAVPAYAVQVARDIGMKSVEAAVALSRGEKAPERINTEFFVVTKQNLDDPKVRALAR